MKTIDLNADLGEGGEHDAELMALISSCNIACGGHAGDEQSMRVAVSLARANGVAIGAHPGYVDREFFGRRFLDLPLDVVTAQIRDQIEALLKIAGSLHHIKLHGALYHQANQDPELAKAFAELALELLPKPLIYAPPTGRLIDAAKAMGLPVLTEGFIDRRYLESGELCPRSEAGAVITDVDEAVEQAIKIANEGCVIAMSGKVIAMDVQTLCVHGDGASAVEILRRLSVF
jgi:5-oxoprolinase (ATP-hydrolysing) subunit A